MNCHEVDEVAAAYALGALTTQERAEVDAHLATCSEHTRMLAGLQNAVDLLPLPVEEIAAPPSLKTALMDAVRKDLARPKPSAASPPRWHASPFRSPVLALLLLAIVGLAAWNVVLQFGWSGGGAFVLPLSGDSGASGRLLYIEQQESGILTVEGLPPLSEGQAYEVWAKTAKGIESRGFLTLLQQGKGVALLSGDILKSGPAFVTVEPVSGGIRPYGTPVLSTRP